MTDSIAKAPIFVLSCARSGSTLMRFAMDSHPAICSPPELHLLQLCQKMLWVYRLTMQDAGADENQQSWSQAISQTRTNIDAIMSDYCQRRSRPRWCEKSITSVNHLDILDGVYPEACRVYLYRNARDMAASGLRAITERPEGYDFEPYLAAWGHNRTEAILRYWADKTESLLEHESRHQPAVRVRYEDLVTDPDQALARLIQDLDLEAIDDWRDRIFAQDHDRGPGDGSIWERNAIDTASVGGGRQLALEGIPRNLIRRINRCHQQLDYEPLS